MLELLFAVLIALGFSFDKSLTADEIKAKDPVAYEQAQKVIDSGNYKTKDGGVIVIEIGGD